MSNVFKPTRTFRIPAGTEVVTRDGKPHVKLSEKGRPVFYPLSKDGKKYLKPTAKWYADVRQADDTVKRVALSANKAAAQMMLADILKRVEMERAGHRDPLAPARKTPLTTHVDDWLAVLAARGRSEHYVAVKRARVTAYLTGTGAVFPPDLAADRLELFLASLRAGKKKLSVQTTNDYLQAVRQFARWMVEAGRLTRNPFASLRRQDAERDRRHVRRVLTVDELRVLLAATRAGGKTRRRLGPADRATLYAVAAYTGYRAQEAKALTPDCFLLDADPPTIDLGAEFTKNRKPASQPVPPALAAELRAFLAGRPAGSPVWPGGWWKRAAEVIAADATAAGLPVEAKTRTGTEVLDFHSLRGTYATILDGLDITLKDRQELMRHSDPRLTMNRYTKSHRKNLAAAAARFPDLTAPGADAVTDAVDGDKRGGSLRMFVGPGEQPEATDGKTEPVVPSTTYERSRAEGERFELSEGLPPRCFSRALP